MRSRRPAWPTAIASALILFFATSVEAVDLSRYRYIIEIGADPEAAELDTQKIRAFCRDPDGCLVTIEYETADDFVAKSTHFFLSPDTLRWATDNKSAADNDGASDIVLEAITGTVPPPVARCVVTLID